MKRLNFTQKCESDKNWLKPGDLVIAGVEGRDLLNKHTVAAT